MKGGLVTAIVLLLSLSAVLAHSGSHGSGEDVVVRVAEYDETTEEFTLNCSVLPGMSETRYYTLRPDNETLEGELTTTSPTWTVNLTSDVLYHIGCQVQNLTSGEYVRGDFHIDRRTGPNTKDPNIWANSTSGLDFTATCEPHEATNYNLKWYLESASEGTQQLTQFDNQEVISYAVPGTGLFDLACGIWDIDRNKWTQWGLPIEFFVDGPAYVPNENGCLPWDCNYYDIPEGEIVPSVEVNVTPNGTEWRLEILTTNFTFVPENNSEHVPGEGHAHVYVDGVKIDRSYTPTYLIGPLSSGQHEIGAILSTRQHQEYRWNGVPIGDFQDVTSTINGTQPFPPTWLEPGQNTTGVDTYDFHIQVFPMVDPDGDDHVATDYEIWDDALNESVWSALNSDILTHIHNADGVFENSLEGDDRLLYDTQYRLRARFYDSDGETSDWSVWQYFRTAEQLTFNNSPFLWTAREGFTVEKMASGINLPVNIAPAPDIYGHLPEDERPKLYMTHLYGQLGVLLNDGSYVEYADELLNYDVFGSLPGSGETGVTGLYVDETTGDLFVSMVYDDPVSGFLGKVERFYTDENGTGYTANVTILDEIPTAPSHQVQQISRGPDGKLYLNTGDDDQPFNSKDLSFLSGKVLRFNDDGSIPADNPFGPSNYVYSAGFRNNFGASWRPETDELYITNNGPDSDDGIYKILGGDIFGWCCNTSEGTWHHWEDTVAPVAAAWDPGTVNFTEIAHEDIGHGEAYESLYVATSGSTYKQGPSIDAKRIVQFRLDENGSMFQISDLVTYTGEGFGTPIGLAFLADGLYFSDIYGEEGFVGVGETRGNIYRVVPGNQTEENETNTGFHALMRVAPWYPQGLNVIWECPAYEGSGDYLYDYYFGDGSKQLNHNQPNVWHTYTDNGTYDASCDVHDLQTSETAHADASIVLGESGGGNGNATLTVTKVVINDDGGFLEVEDFSLFINGTQVTSGEQNSLVPGWYRVTEIGNINYTATITGACDATGLVELGAGDTKQCTITNNDVNQGGGTCYSSVENIPATCTGGTITQDTFGGCRTIVCGGLQVLACDKPDHNDPDFFEMYKQTSTSGVEICLLDTCISSNGYAKSSDYPICTGEPPVCTDEDSDSYAIEGGVCGDIDCDDSDASVNPGATEVCNGIDDDCDGLVDEDDVCGPPPPSNESVTLSIAPWFPQGNNVVFHCTPDGFTPTSYSWVFGDGNTQITNADNVWHTYPGAGEYEVMCTASSASESESDYLNLTLA